MAQDIVNENQKISYTNLDFSAIYAETIDLIKQLTYRWDPSISDESDPGVVLVKLSALLADKMNYNIDKNVLETFPLSVTQEGNARQLYDQLGYYMHWYESGATPVSLTWTGEPVTELNNEDQPQSITYRIPKFTTIVDTENSVSKRYSLIGVEGPTDNVVSDIFLNTDGNPVTAIALEGLAVQYQYEGETVITSQMVDPLSRRLYFTTAQVSQNGVFIKNTGQENYAEWRRVDNLYEDNPYELRYIFGYDSNSNTCYLEFPDNYAELFGSGIEITYLLVDATAGEVKAGELVQFMSPIAIYDDKGNNIVTLSSDNVRLVNYLASVGHKDVETINEAYTNYKKTVGTFKTLITLRDYANYIRQQNLNVCSNAFVCDRTNDIQTSYKVMNKSHGLDNLIVKVEKVTDKNAIKTTMNYTFNLSNDVTDKGKDYYIYDVSQEKVVPFEGVVTNPQRQQLYELTEVTPDGSTTLDPYSLKFYLLKTSIALDSKAAYNETFNVLHPYPDLDSLFDETSHIEHTYGDILPLGENSYIKSQDTEWDPDKSYWLYDPDEKTYSLITTTSNTPNIEGTPAETANCYEIAVEALMPHTVLFKAVYPVQMNISTYNVLDSETQAIVEKNIINALYPALASAEMNWGEEASVEYLSQTAKAADDRIKAVTIEPISYELRAVFYDKEDDMYKEVYIDPSLSQFKPDSQRNLASIISSTIKQDIFAKSVLAGTSQLLVKDTDFIYHLSQDFKGYYDGVVGIKPEAIIDIATAEAMSYATEGNSHLRKTYELQENEILTLYRPELLTEREFLNGVRYEYVLFNNVKANSVYTLGTGEYLIFYTPIIDEESNTLTGYTAYACGAGSQIETTFALPYQTAIGNLSNFARASVLPNLISTMYREFTTTNSSYMNEISNSTIISNNKITGTNSVKLKSVNTAELKVSDRFKFFWLLNRPTYSSKDNLKTFTLFDSYDSYVQDAEEETINSYTLKQGEYFIYTNNDYSIPEILGAGTTITRNCGVDGNSHYTQITNGLYYVYWNKLDQILEGATNIAPLIDDATGQMKPYDMGLYVVETDTPINIEEYLDEHDMQLSDLNPFILGWYERRSDIDSAITYYQPTTDTKVEDISTEYYEVTFERTTDTLSVSGTAYYLMCMRKSPSAYKQAEDGTYVSDSLDDTCFEQVNPYTTDEENNIYFVDPTVEHYYKQVTIGTTTVKDTYSMYPGVFATEQPRYTSAMGEKDSVVFNRNILSDDPNYRNVDITDPLTYQDIAFGNTNFNASEHNLYEPLYDEETEEIIGAKSSNSHELFNEQSAKYDLNTSTHEYYYIPNDIRTYRVIEDKSYLSAAVAQPEMAGTPLDILYELYQKVVATTESDIDTWLKMISNTYWKSAYTFSKPYTTDITAWDSEVSYKYDNLVYYDTLIYKCCVPYATLGEFKEDEWIEVDVHWQAFEFTDTGRPADRETAGGYLKVSSNNLISAFNADTEDRTRVGNIYPALELVTPGDPTDAYFYIAATPTRCATLEDAGVALGTVYTIGDYPTNPLDTDEKLQALFPNEAWKTQRSLKNIGYVQIYYLPKLFKFHDYIKLSDTTYYKEKELYRKSSGRFDAWTCTALNSEDVRDNPYESIGTLWATMQPNTSITITGNEIISLGQGDTIVFEAVNTNTDSIEWPKFTTLDTKIDSNTFDVTYTRKGASTAVLPKSDKYIWRGYSILQLNVADANGQRLLANHTISLYNAEDAEEPIGVISGKTSTDITIQFKNKIRNTEGNFISVYTITTLGDRESNIIYAFVPRPNGDNYKFNTYNYSTSLLFNSVADGTIYVDDGSRATVVMPVSLPGGHYLMAIEQKNDVNMDIIFNNIFEGQSLDAPLIENASGGAALDDNYINYLHSYVTDDTVFTGAHYDYIYMHTGENGYFKLNSTFLMSARLGLSPKDLGWYEWDEDKQDYVESSNENVGDAILVVATDTEGKNPEDEGWYEHTSKGWIFSHDTEADTSKTYYHDIDMYVSIDDIESSLSFTIDKTDKIYTYVIDDIFKFNPNPEVGDFELIKNRIKRLDVDKEYNYTYTPLANDLIENPIRVKSFFNPTHIFNRYIIPQIDFDNLEMRFTTTKAYS